MQTRHAASLQSVVHVIPVDGGEVGGVVLVVGVGHVPPEALEVFAQLFVAEHVATVGVGQVADDALAEGRVGGNLLHSLVGSPVDLRGAVVGATRDALLANVAAVDSHGADGQFSRGAEVGGVEGDGAVAEAHLGAWVAVAGGASRLAHALADGEGGAGKRAVEDVEVLGRAVGADGECEVANLASGPAGGGRQLVFDDERAAHIGRHAVDIGVAHAVEARLEVGVEVVDVGEADAGIVVYRVVVTGLRVGVGGVVEPVVVPHVVAFQVFDLRQRQRVGHAYGVVVRQPAAVHFDGEEADAGVAAVGVELIVVVVRRVGFESHGETLGGAGVPELVLHIHAGHSVVHQADGQCLALHADVRLLQGDELVATGVECAVVGRGG